MAQANWPDLPVGIKNGIYARVGDTIYVGLGTAGQALYALDLTNPAAGWVEKAGFAGPATNGATAAVSNGKIVVFGGNGLLTPDAKSAVIFDSVYSYDPAADVWSKLDTTTPAGLSGARSYALPDGRIALFGGYNKSLFDKYLSDISAIDQKTQPDLWATTVNAYMGMQPADYRWNDKVLSFDPASTTWAELGADPLDPNCDAALIVDGENLVLVSGEIKPGLRSPKVKSVAFTADKATFTELHQLPVPLGSSLQEGIAGAFGGKAGNTVLVAGGANFPGAIANSLAGKWYAHEGLTKTWNTKVYAFHEGGWLDAGDLPEGLAYGASFTLPEGILLVGGEDSQKAARPEVRLMTFDGTHVAFTD